MTSNEAPPPVGASHATTAADAPRPVGVSAPGGAPPAAASSARGSSSPTTSASSATLTGAALALLVAASLVVAAPRWKELARDGLHDEQSAAVGVLQEPAEALGVLPADTAGNRVNWVKALREGYINPRTNIYPETEVQLLDLDIVMPETGDAPMVLFPHLAHTEWLDCGNCHERLFRSQAGATPVTMLQILQGEYCGQCHGAVAFPLTECDRCHSVPFGSRPPGAAKPGDGG